MGAQQIRFGKVAERAPARANLFAAGATKSFVAARSIDLLRDSAARRSRQPWRKIFRFFLRSRPAAQKTEKLQLHDTAYAPRFCTFFVFFDSGTGVAFGNPPPKFFQIAGRARRRDRQATGQAKIKRRPLGRRSARSEIGQWIRLRASAHAN
jgi:hypothetical protein